MASPVDTSVKSYNEGMYGAPVLNGVAGALVALVKACLVTGFGIRTPTSIVVAGGVATVTTASEAKNLAMIDTVLAVSGITGALTALNGEQKITGATLTTLTFATTAADGTAAGTLSIKTAPAGWDETYSTTNVSCLRSLDPASLGAFVRIDDTGTTSAGVRMYETMSAHSTGTNQSPLVADAAVAQWVKSLAANSNACKWDLFSDSRAFHFCPVPGSGSTATLEGTAVYTFGEIIPTKSVDPYAVWLSTSQTLANSYGSSLYGLQGGVTQAPTRLLRAYTGLGVGIQAYGVPLSGTSSSHSGADSYWGTFPSVDGKVQLTKIRVTEGSPTGPLSVSRGLMPGLLYVPTTGGGASFPRGTKITVDGRKLYCVRECNAFNEALFTNGFGWVDISGPWR